MKTVTLPVELFFSAADLSLKPEHLWCLSIMHSGDKTCNPLFESSRQELLTMGLVKLTKEAHGYDLSPLWKKLYAKGSKPASKEWGCPSPFFKLPISWWHHDALSSSMAVRSVLALIAAFQYRQAHGEALTTDLMSQALGIPLPSLRKMIPKIKARGFLRTKIWSRTSGKTLVKYFIDAPDAPEVPDTPVLPTLSAIAVNAATVNIPFGLTHDPAMFDVPWLINLLGVNKLRDHICQRCDKHGLFRHKTEWLKATLDVMAVPNVMLSCISGENKFWYLLVKDNSFEALLANMQDVEENLDASRFREIDDAEEKAKRGKVEDYTFTNLADKMSNDDKDL